MGREEHTMSKTHTPEVITALRKEGTKGEGTSKEPLTLHRRQGLWEEPSDLALPTPRHPPGNPPVSPVYKYTVSPGESP